MYLVFTRMPDESYRMQFMSLLWSCDVFGAVIIVNSLCLLILCNGFIRFQTEVRKGFSATFSLFS